MSDQTNIEWADSTFNPWIGCTKVSPACDHCYAERDTKRFGRVEWGAGKPRVRTSAANWKLPERWNAVPFFQCQCGWRGSANELVWKSEQDAHCAACGTENIEEARRRVFCASLADWLDNEVPIGWLVDLLDLIRRTPNLDWLLLTKRIGNWSGRLKKARLWMSAQPKGWEETWQFVADWQDRKPPANVWVGATVVHQAEVDRDVPKLLQVPARVRFLSIEPMLGPIDLTVVHIGDLYFLDALRGRETILHDGGMPTKGLFGAVDWIIAGGESGPHARPMHPDWVRSLRDQCAAAGVPFLFKQHGEWLATDFCSDEDAMLPSRRTVYVNRDGSYVDGTEGFDFFAGFKETAWVGKKAAGRQLDGRTHDGFPAVQP